MLLGRVLLTSDLAPVPFCWTLPSSHSDGSCVSLRGLALTALVVSRGGHMTLLLPSTTPTNVLRFFQIGDLLVGEFSGGGFAHLVAASLFVNLEVAGTAVAIMTSAGRW